MTDIKLYPSLAGLVPSAPDEEGARPEENQVYRLKKIEEVEQYLRGEAKERDKLAKKFKMHGTWVRYTDHGLLAVGVITSGVGLGSMISGIGVPLAVAMGGITIAVSLGEAGLRNAGKQKSTGTSGYSRRLSSILLSISLARQWRMG